MRCGSCPTRQRTSSCRAARQHQPRQTAPPNSLAGYRLPPWRRPRPGPTNVLVELAAWSGLRAGELAGLTIAAAKPGAVHVTRTLAHVGSGLTYLPPNTKGSQRRLPLTPATTALLREYLTQHPRGGDPSAPCSRLTPARPTGVADPLTLNQRVRGKRTGSREKAQRQATALAGITTADAADLLALLVPALPARDVIQGRVPACGAAG